MHCLIVKLVFRCERPNLLKNFEPTTIGEHIRKKRLESGLTLDKLSKKWEIRIDKLLHWERGRRVSFELYSMIFSFLGYVPMQLNTLPPRERLVALRKLSRTSQKNLAKKLGMKITDIVDFESGKQISKESEKIICDYLSMII